MVINDNEEVAEAISYQPYGTMETVGGLSSVMGTREQFTKKEFDTEGGSGSGVDGIRLNYFGARYYDPEVGVWNSVEPAPEPQDLGSYAYCNNNPILKTDPDGRAAWVSAIALGLTLWGMYEDEKKLQNAQKDEIDPNTLHPTSAPGILPAYTSLTFAPIIGSAFAKVGVKKAESIVGKQLEKSIVERKAAADVLSTAVAKSVFPENPANLLPDTVHTVKANGKRVVNASDKVRIRADEAHPLKAGETFNPRHHDQHYHVETKIDPKKSWNNPTNVQKIYPPDYQPGKATGFLPGEDFP